MDTPEQWEASREVGPAALVPLLARALTAAALAGMLATLLLVARNELAPVQRPLSFGLAFWAAFALFYGAIGLPGAVGVWLFARHVRRPGLAERTLAIAVVAFLATALIVNSAALARLFALEGPGRFRLLAPVAALSCTLALLALVAARGRGQAAARWLAALALALGLGALLPSGSGAAKAATARPAAPGVSRQPLLVIGVDGADWEYVKALIARGELPNLAALQQRGAWGSLDTLQPTLSPRIWTSMVTGKAPEEHGIEHFLSSRVRGVDAALPALRALSGVGLGPASATLRWLGLVHQTTTNGSQRRVPAFWNIASAHGSAVNVVSWWATWPAEPVLGAMVSETVHSRPPNRDGTLPATDRVTHPEALYGEIARYVMRPEETSYEEASLFMDLTPEQFRAVRAREGGGIDRELTYYYSYFETTRRIALHLIESGRTRYGAPADTLVLFRIVDKTCHASLDDSELIRHKLRLPRERVRRYGRVVTAAYRLADKAIGELLSAFGPGNVIVVSDHGFDVQPHRPRPWSNHRQAPSGIFLGAGPAFRPGRVEGLSVYDILPLMLYLKGFPIADDFVEGLDERVIADEFMARHPVRRVASYGRRGGPQSARMESDVEAQAIDRLRALGYVQ